MLASTVSSKMLSALAEQEGLYFEETLTGFKWLGNRSIELERQGYTVHTHMYMYCSGGARGGAAVSGGEMG